MNSSQERRVVAVSVRLGQHARREGGGGYSAPVRLKVFCKRGFDTYGSCYFTYRPGNDRCNQPPLSWEIVSLCAEPAYPMWYSA